MGVWNELKVSCKWQGYFHYIYKYFVTLTRLHCHWGYQQLGHVPNGRLVELVGEVE